MIVNEFINRLEELAVSKTKLMEIGYDENYAQQLSECFYLKPTNNQSLGKNIILQLIEEYNCKPIGLLSPISLDETFNENEKYYLIGILSTNNDILAINRTNGEVVALTYWDLNSISYYCAQNSEKFLEAFLIHGVQVGIAFSNDDKQWQYNMIKAKEAAIAAGGNKYFKFWMDLYPTSNDMSDDPNEQFFLN
jgi:hypothetical protein